MPIIDNSTIKTFTLPGLVHQTVAGPAHGLKTLEVWVETIAPGAGTPVHRHDCEEVFVILTGGRAGHPRRPGSGLRAQPHPHRASWRGSSSGQYRPGRYASGRSFGGGSGRGHHTGRPAHPRPLAQ